MPFYSITFRPRALTEYLASTIWYQKHSTQAAENFIAIVDTTIVAISQHPYSYKNTYKKFYEVKTKKYPFSIVYFIDESKQRIVITTIFHHKRNPLKKFR